MFKQLEQGTIHPEAASWHMCTQMFTVVIGYPRNFRGTTVLQPTGTRAASHDETTLLDVSNLIWPTHLLDINYTWSDQHISWISAILDLTNTSPGYQLYLIWLTHLLDINYTWSDQHISWISAILDLTDTSPRYMYQLYLIWPTHLLDISYTWSD